METNIPKTSIVLSALLKADIKTQWRNRRSVVLTLLIPVIILFSWREIVDKIGVLLPWHPALQSVLQQLV
jgi:ABC-2 type transport system permease protein